MKITYGTVWLNQLNMYHSISFLSAWKYEVGTVHILRHTNTQVIFKEWLITSYTVDWPSKVRAKMFDIQFSDEYANFKCWTIDQLCMDQICLLEAFVACLFTNRLIHFVWRKSVITINYWSIWESRLLIWICRTITSTW